MQLDQPLRNGETQARALGRFYRLTQTDKKASKDAFLLPFRRNTRLQNHEPPLEQNSPAFLSSPPLRSFRLRA